jgi:hypothetical protein
LWVLRDNRRARRFYTRAGYAADGATQDDVYEDIHEGVHRDVTLTELRYLREL